MKVCITELTRNMKTTPSGVVLQGGESVYIILFNDRNEPCSYSFSVISINIPTPINVWRASSPAIGAPSSPSGNLTA